MSGKISDNQGRSSGLVKSGAITYDDDKLQSNIALLGFKTAVNGSLAKYNLQDQIIDEYEDATGIDASASTNEILASGAYSGVGTATTAITYSYTGTEQTFTVPSGVTSLFLAVWGAGGGQFGNSGTGGGGGAANGNKTVSASDVLKIIVGQSVNSGYAFGGGGHDDQSVESGNGGSGGGYSGIFTTSVAHGNSILIGGGGAGGAYGGVVGGYGGGTSGQGGQGGGNNGAGGTSSGGGAGAGSGTSGSALQGGNGYGNGSGGGGGWYGGGGGTQGASDGGGGGGSGYIGGLTSAGVMVAGSSSTGGGQGYTGYPGSNIGNGENNGAAYISYSGPVANNLTLQSTDTTAMTEPDYADMVMLMENAEGTATINTDIKGYISKDSGSTFTEGTLVDEGTWGTNKKILAFHDLDISAQSGTSMCYKITTHNQSAGSKETKIHATSIGWKA